MKKMISGAALRKEIWPPGAEPKKQEAKPKKKK